MTNQCFSYGNFLPLRIKCEQGSAVAFLRESKSNLVLVLCNLHNQLTKKIKVIISTRIKKKYETFRFNNYMNKDWWVTIDQLYFEEFHPFRTEVFIGREN
jgi:maltooligosyltrehalose synthase